MKAYQDTEVLGRSGVRWAFSALVGWCALGSALAHAQFSYKTCSTTSYTYVPVNIGTSEFERRTFDSSFYADLGEYTWTTFFSGNVNLFWPRMKNFQTEYSYDYLDLATGSGFQRYTGFYSDGYTGGYH